MSKLVLSLPFGAKLRVLAWRMGHGAYCFFRLFRWLTVWSAARVICWRVANRFGWSKRSIKLVNLRGARGALFMRAGSSSDFSVFKQIFLEEEYGPLRAMAAPRVIIDCGANVGYASRFLLDAFPDCRVIAIEPDPENFKVCELNLEPFRGRSAVRLAAVWPESTRLNLLRGAFADGREHASQVRASGKDETPDVLGIDIATLLEEEKIGRVDLLKIDIEGSELELFRSACSRLWLSKVGNIAIELHNEECSNAFFDALAGFRYSLLRWGELHVCLNIEALIPTTSIPEAAS